MRYDIDPKTLKKASPRAPIPEYKPQVVSNTFVFEGKPTDTGKVSSIKLTGTSGKLECYTEWMRSKASHNTVRHNKKTRVITAISGTLYIDYYSPQEGLVVVEDLLTNSKILSIGEFVQLNPGECYRLYTKDIDCLFSVVQESGYEDRLLIENNTLNPGIEEIVSTRYKSKAREQLAVLNPQEQQVLTSNTKIVDEGLNSRPLSVQELESM